MENETDRLRGITQSILGYDRSEREKRIEELLKPFRTEYEQNISRIEEITPPRLDPLLMPEVQTISPIPQFVLKFRERYNEELSKSFFLEHAPQIPPEYQPNYRNDKTLFSGERALQLPPEFAKKPKYSDDYLNER